MVKRCGFYVAEGKVNRADVEIAWDLGWTKDAKHFYVKRLHDALYEIFPGQQIIEVTSASQSYGKALSPLFVRMRNGVILEDYIQTIIQDSSQVIEYDNFIWPKSARNFAFMHLYCLHAQYLINRIRATDVFTDVFYNPEKTSGTQALVCAMMKLMDVNKEFCVLGSVVDFVNWCGENINVEV